uniref:Pentatricopeptide repeat-containing protein n=1 Tax=Leersia perrieri TaxID=77586 RepID=A0A0D9Y098_9ORYZ
MTHRGAVSLGRSLAWFLAQERSTQRPAPLRGQGKAARATGAHSLNPPSNVVMSKQPVVLIDMYSKYGWLEKARRFLEMLKEKDMVSSTCMIAGHVHHEYCKEDLAAFKETHKCVKYNVFTFVSALSDSASKCGSIEDSRWTFLKCPRDTRSPGILLLQASHNIDVIWRL